jgi:hypothetical protein
MRAVFTFIQELDKKTHIERAAVIVAVVIFLVQIVGNIINTPVHLLAKESVYIIIKALALPFSILLLYEVFLMILAISKSLYRSLAKQYEIITLISVSSIFKTLQDEKILINKDFF